MLRVLKALHHSLLMNCAIFSSWKGFYEFEFTKYYKETTEVNAMHRGNQLVDRFKCSVARKDCRCFLPFHRTRVKLSVLCAWKARIKKSRRLSVKIVLSVLPLKTFAEGASLTKKCWIPHLSYEMGTIWWGNGQLLNGNLNQPRIIEKYSIFLVSFPKLKSKIRKTWWKVETYEV